MPLSISLLMQFEPHQKEDKEDPPILVVAEGISHSLAIKRDGSVTGAAAFRNEIEVGRMLPKIIAHKSLHAEINRKDLNADQLHFILRAQQEQQLIYLQIGINRQATNRQGKPSRLSVAELFCQAKVTNYFAVDAYIVSFTIVRVLNKLEPEE
jgi:hypothetical protein